MFGNISNTQTRVPQLIFVDILLSTDSFVSSSSPRESAFPCILNFHENFRRLCMLFPSLFSSLPSPDLRQTNGFNYSFEKRERNIDGFPFRMPFFKTTQKANLERTVVVMCLYNCPKFVWLHRDNNRVSIHRRSFFNISAKWEWNINQYFDTKRYRKKTISANLLWFMIMISHY